MSNGNSFVSVSSLADRSPTDIPDTVPLILAFQVSSDSSKMKSALSEVPRSTSIPDEPLVTPAPVSPSFNRITLSVISVLVVEILVNVPLTVKLPVIVAFPPTDRSPVDLISSAPVIEPELIV